MLQNTPNCTIRNAPNPHSKHMATPRVANPPPPQKKKNSWPPLANPAHAHELLLRN